MFGAKRSLRAQHRLGVEDWSRLSGRGLRRSGQIQERSKRASERALDLSFSRGGIIDGPARPKRVSKRSGERNRLLASLGEGSETAQLGLI